jgi:hypothetical protein
MTSLPICHVCGRNWSSTNSKVVATKCGHLFCEGCIDDSMGCFVCHHKPPHQLVKVHLDFPQGCPDDVVYDIDTIVDYDVEEDVDERVTLHNIKCFTKLDQPCPICLEPLFIGSSDMNPIVTQCGHVTHSKCFLDLLLHDKTKCVLCNTPIQINKSRVLHV